MRIVPLEKSCPGNVLVIFNEYMDIIILDEMQEQLIILIITRKLFVIFVVKLI